MGVDPGGRKFDAFVLLEEPHTSTALVHSFEAEKSSVGSECDAIARHARQFFDGIVSAYGVIPVIFIEAPVVAGARNLQTSLRIAQTAGALHTVMFDSYQVSVAEWKKTVIGKGNVGKPEVKAWIQKQYPNLAKMCSKQDHFDAAAIALFGREKLAIAGRFTGPADCSSGGGQVPEFAEPVA